MKSSGRWTRGLLLTAACLGAAFAAPLGAQDPVKLAPDHIKVVLENDRVRVLDDSSRPGDHEAMHSHPACIIHVIAGGKVRSTNPDGKVTVLDLKTGDTVWREPTTHAVENIGTTDLHLLLVELKR